MKTISRIPVQSPGLRLGLSFFLNNLVARRWAWLLGLFFIAVWAIPVRAAEDPADPALLVDVPAGVYSVKIEYQPEAGGAWQVLSVAHLDGRAGTVKFRLPPGLALDRFRLFSSDTETLPYRLTFGAQIHTATPMDSNRGNYAYPAAGDVSMVADGSEKSGGANTVVESDIWKVSGQQLFFFNAYRGLQIFDLTDPAQPKLTGSLRVSTLGEQMYQLNDRYLLLLGSNGWNSDASLFVVELTAQGPVLASTLQVKGGVHESRLVGSVLYTAGSYYAPVTTADPAGEVRVEYGPTTVLNAFDFADPAVPVYLGSYSLAGYASAVTATPDYFMVALQSWLYANRVGYQPRDAVALFDLSDPATALAKPAALVPVAGQISDKFKLSVEGDILTTLSMVWVNSAAGRHTLLENFRLTAEGEVPVAANPLPAPLPVLDPLPGDGKPPVFVPPAPPPSIELPHQEITYGAVKLADLMLAPGETLFATRFDGARVYVVTFLIKDPLFIVDLSNPAQPVVSGQLDVPGYSTYLAPLGDRLFSVGLETNRVTLSLFDVADAAKPSQLARVYLGDDAHGSWSEATWDEKAVGLLPAQGLALVPFQSWTETGYVNRMQLVAVKDNDLVLRGTLDHQFQARRATALDETHLVSISGRELLTVDAADRSQPKVLADIRLSWPVDQVFVSDERLVQVERGNRGWGGGASTLFVAPADAPDSPSQVLSLGDQPVAWTHWDNDTLWLLQGEQNYYYPMLGRPGGIWAVDDAAPAPSPPRPVSFRSFQLSAEGVLAETARFDFTVPSEGGLVWQCFPLDNGRWVLAATEGGWYSWWNYRGVVLDTAADKSIAPDPWWGGALARFFTVDLGAEPALLAVTSFNPENLYNLSAFHLLGQTLYFSYSIGTWDATNQEWWNAQYLQPLSLADPASPTFLPPHSLPGGLIGMTNLSPQADLIWTQETKAEKWMPYDGQTEVGYWTDWRSYLCASLFDGAAVYEVAREPLSNRLSTLTVHDRQVLATLYANGQEMAEAHLYRYSIEAGLQFAASASLDSQWWSGVRYANGFWWGLGYDQQARLWRLSGDSLTLATQPVNGGYYPDLGGAWLTPDTAWLAAGDYGVVQVTFPPDPVAEASAALPSHRLTARSTGAVWTSLSLSQAQLGQTQAADAVGILQQREWLFRPAGVPAADPAAQDLGDGWRRSAWLGDYHELAAPWVASAEHGWAYAWPVENSGVYLWQSSTDWMWTGPVTYPFFYNFDEQAWWQYLPGSSANGQRWFFNYRDGVYAWQSVVF